MNVRDEEGFKLTAFEGFFAGTRSLREVVEDFLEMGSSFLSVAGVFRVAVLSCKKDLTLVERQMMRLR